jgi:hypothetical protein
MARKIIIGLLLALSLAYAALTYWPLLTPYLPGPIPSPKLAPAAPAPTPVALLTREATAQEKSDIDLLYLPTREVRSIDPFALRVEIKKRAILPPPPPEADKSGTPAPTVKPIELHLEGVWVDSGMKVAFISGQTLSVGGTILGWRVSSINREQVVLTKGTQTKIMRVEGK